MGRTVHLDRSSWSPEALARHAQMEADRLRHKEYLQACREHPFARALDDVSDASMSASCRDVQKLKITDFKNGLREVVIWRHRPDPERSLERAIDRDLRALAPRGEGDRDASRRRAARRATQQVRRVCKSMITNSLWTLTYKANVTDRELALKHFAQFRRRVLAVLPGWKYVAVLQRQERGAWHVHLATHELAPRITLRGVKFKSWDLLRAIWRSCTGELQGTFNEAKRKRRWGGGWKPIKGAGAIASYIAGYVAADMLQSDLNRKRFSHSEDVEIPPSMIQHFPPDTPLLDLLRLAYEALGDRITRRWFDPISGVFFAESDDTRAIGSG